MSSSIRNVVISHRMQKIGLTVAVLIASIGTVSAQDHQSQSAYPTQYQRPSAAESQNLAVSRWDRARFDHSGTRGREGLGASPMHPEGPGDPSY
ncbi:hypothetical protein [Methylocapsa acidiphila]|uniref:hypothetical protein n=1 Tax=Methylocapsa acidiphila TaxID=133552 RepID=UPI000411183A|nr:hypothetical protein [Methylocapsa acidiphila]